MRGLVTKRFANILAGVSLLVTTGNVVAMSHHQLSMCHIGSRCKACIERAPFTITPHPADKRVVTNGISSQGQPVETETRDCEFKDGMNWVCRDGRMLMASVNGKVTLTYLGKPLKLRGQTVEVCLR